MLVGTKKKRWGFSDAIVVGHWADANFFVLIFQFLLDNNYFFLVVGGMVVDGDDTFP
jgi:hypothetical protein